MIELEPGPGPNEWSTDDLSVVLAIDMKDHEFPWTMRVYGEWIPTRGRRGARNRRWRTPHDALAWVSRNIPSAIKDR